MTTIARVALAMGVLALATSASSAGAAGLQTGLLDPGAIARGGVYQLDPGVAAAKTEGAGGRLIRLYLYWRLVAPSGQQEPNNPAAPATYTWTAGGLQNAVEAARAQGLHVMLTIRSAPDYAQRGTPNARGSQNPDPTMLKHFTLAAVQKFGPDVKYWGVWNEPNLKSFLAPQYKNGKLVSPDLYRNLLNAAGPVIRSHGGTVVAGETAPFHFVFNGKPSNPGPLLFLRKLLCMSGGSHPRKICPRDLPVDIIATHPYTSGNPWHHAVRSDDVSFGDLPEWKRLVKRAAAAGQFTQRSIGLWITEFSWDTKPPDPDAVPTRLQARWTSEALYRTWQLGIAALLWGQLRDYPLSFGDGYGQYQSGLYYCDAKPSNGCEKDAIASPTDKTKKPAFQAFRFPFVAYDSNGHVRVWGRTPQSDHRSLVIERKVSGGWKKMINVDSAGSGIFTKKFRSSVQHGLVRARFGSTKSRPFSLDRPPDRFFNPFGCGGSTPC